MSAIQAETHLSVEQLLKATEQLSNPDLEQFTSEVIKLGARRRAPSLPKNEAELLLKINQGIPPEVWKRYNELIAKREAEMLAPGDAEYNELLKLIDQVEILHAQRLKYLAELAELRGTTLSHLMEKLEIRNPSYA
jgi:hypothetical protein